ncbi:hypothetical protein [Butyricimonas synergistica]|uniref:hypothetical protein n=1 Tax=Butyricimonas synergistica TaxID=544644 RepID=UPI0003779053|nr:hypothetical protein [Butyricimonas synergistica]
MLINGLKHYSRLPFFAIVLLFMSCIDEKLQNDTQEGFITFSGINSRSYEGSFPGDGIDSKVETLRIIAFKTDGTLESNVLYYGSALSENTLRHPIDQGEYNFIFLANEPPNTGIKAILDNIADYDGIKSISFPAEYFNSDKIIPMIAENNAVKILTDGKFEIGGNINSELTIGLRRLAARVDVVLKSKIDWGVDNNSEFDGIAFTNLPDRVPLVHGLPSDHPAGTWAYDDPTQTYNGTAITRSVERKFTMADNADYFDVDPTLLSAADKANGFVWAVKVKKVIIPSSFFTTKSAEGNAVVFTVNLINKYSPSCKLKILSDPDYRLPANARLELIGNIQEPLEVNIKPAPWTRIEEEWEIAGIRKLNVSQTDVKMTDQNGVRISFWSNMPVVKVLATVQKEGEAAERPTNEVFNCLTVDANNPNPYRFEFDPTTGSGYMDLLIDGTNRISGTPHDRTENMSGKYTLILSAEEANGKKPLQRTITVTVTQTGLRFVHNPTANQHGLFNAVFFKHDQKGERIITGQHAVDRPWSVKIPDAFQDWLVVSATPSFDPAVGTEYPGDAEHYQVIPNQYRVEKDGKEIKNINGRIYFRIGVKESANYVPSETSTPKFGYVDLTYYPGGWQTTMRIYVRQGEAPAYIYTSTDPIPDVVHNGWNGNTDITAQVRSDMRLTSSNTRRKAAKFAPYNLTTTKLSGYTDPDYENVGIKGARFVDFPSQAGALFQWAVDLNGTITGMTNYYRRGFNPSRSFLVTGFPWDYPEFPIMWDGATGIAVYKNTFEICPTGYRRPTDGYTNQISYNGYYDYLPAASTPGINHLTDVEYSEFRVSLFNVPFAGNAASSADYKTVYDNVVGTKTGPGTYPYGTSGIARKQLRNTTFTFYSDGFFDRRPIKEPSSGNYGVSIDNSQVGYQGVLYFNPTTYASIFFPATGRLNNITGKLESPGSTGYYWSASASPAYTRSELTVAPNDRRVRYGAWSFESAYNSMNFRVSYQGFAQAVRCVAEISN